MVIIDNKQYYTRGEFADLIGRSVSTLTNYEYRGIITPDKVSGRRHFYSPEQIEKFLAGSVIPINVENPDIKS